MRAPIVPLAIAGAALFAALALGGPQEPDARLRVGTYDNRAVAVAYAPSRFNPVKERMVELRAAQEADDQERVAELEAWGQAHQRALHRQGFGRVPVDDLLDHVRDRLPEVARDAGVDLIAWQVDYAPDGVELVDVTDELVALFDPSEKTLKTVAELRRHDPIDLDEIEKGHEH